MKLQKRIFFFPLILLIMPQSATAITLDVNLKDGGRQKFEISAVRKISYDMAAPIKMIVSQTDNTSASFEISAIKSVAFGGKPAQADSPAFKRIGEQLASFSTRKSGAAASIRFSLSKPSQVTVALHSVKGALIRIVSKDHYTAGSHVIFWENTGRGSARVASGNYILKISGIGQTQAFKFVTVK
jgi:hypothetical protein